MADKFIIYQLLPRVFGNNNSNCVPNGSLLLNGSGKFNTITAETLSKIKELSVTHIWYTGVIEHATKTDFSEFGIPKDNPSIIKGEAGSPYAIKDYYDVNPYLADNISNRMAEFEALIERTHSAGLKVIIDFVPNHVARCYCSDSLPAGAEDLGSNDTPGNYISGCSYGFNPNNNFYYLPDNSLNLSHITSDKSYVENPAKVTGNNCFSDSPGINDWYETVKLNYGIDYLDRAKCHFNPVPKTWKMMFDILMFWAAKGVDGFRCDMAEMVPVEFWHWVIMGIKRKYPQLIFIAEVYNPVLYGSYLNEGKFDYLYDKVGLYDNLKAITQSHSAASTITSNWQTLGNIENDMLNFLENHDEQRVASDFNIGNPFKAIPELVVSLMLNKAPFMLYFGQEFGERGMLAEGFSGCDGRTSIFDYCSAPSVVRFFENNLTDKEVELYSIYKELCSIAMGERAINSGDTYDLEYANFNNPAFNPNTQFAFARYTRQSINDITAPKELIIITVDFSQPATGTRIGANLPKHFFDYWNIISGKEYRCHNLLTREIFTTAIFADTIFEIPLEKYGISIIKFEI